VKEHLRTTLETSVKKLVTNKVRGYIAWVSRMTSSLRLTQDSPKPQAPTNYPAIPHPRAPSPKFSFFFAKDMQVQNIEAFS
jgi:hypothetical protein